MTDFRKLTLNSLRDLARKHLEKGYSKLTKEELIQALKNWLPKPIAKAVALKKPAAAGAAPAKPTRKRKGQPKRKTPATRAATNVTQIPRQPVEAEASKKVEFVEERFFETLEEQPSSEEDNLVHLQRAEVRGNFLVALVRDPSSAYVFCAIETTTMEVAGQGIEGARPVLRVSEDEGIVRQHYLRPHGGALYLHGLTPGKKYTLEAVILGGTGNIKPLGLTASLELPSRSSFPSQTVRMLRMPWRTPLGALEDLAEQGGLPVVRTKEGVTRQVQRALSNVQSSLLAGSSERLNVGSSSLA
jgi:hypothetical protein